VSSKARISAAQNTKTKTTSNLPRHRWNADDFPGRLADRWYPPPSPQTHLPVCVPARSRRSLSPTRKLALEQLAAKENPASRKYRAAKSLLSSHGAGSDSGSDGCREVVVYQAAASVLDIDKLVRRADKRRDEVALHLLWHDPGSALFRAALQPPSPHPGQLSLLSPAEREMSSRLPSACRERRPSEADTVDGMSVSCTAPRV